MPTLPSQTVFSRAELRVLGWSTDQVDVALRAGVLTALRRDQYAVTARLPASVQDRAALHVVAAVRATRHDVVGSHETAAAVYGLDLLQPYDGPLRVTRVRGEATPSARALAPLVSAVPMSHRVVVRQAPVTSLPRTAVDLARCSSPMAGLVALDSALRRGTTSARLQRVVDDCAGWPGISRARLLVPLADAGSESALESVGRWRLHEAGLPAPELQVVLAHHPDIRVDFCWSEHGVVGEADGRQKYADGDLGAPDNALRREKQRQERLEDLGLVVFRFGWVEAVHRPHLLVAKAERAFARAALLSRAA